MLTSIGTSIIRLYFILIAGSAILECLSVEENNVFSINSFGFDFLNKYSYLKDEGNLDLQSNCSMQLQLIETAIKRKELWALKFTDAWAKIPAGILYENNMDMGNFDECLSINKHLRESSDIEGKYCLSSLEVTELQIKNNLSSTQKVNLELGICIPNTCGAFEIQLLLNKYIQKYWNITSFNSSITLAEQKCTTKNRGPFKVLDWIAIGILIMLGVLMILSTSFQYIARKNGKSFNHLWTAFSIHKNMSQLMRLTPNNETPKHIIPALNGIRCLSIIWIIFLHTYMMLILSPNVNNAEIDTWQQTPFHMIWKNGSYAVDTFFFLSGLLLVSVAFREMEKNSGKLNVSLMYLHRFIRLSPILYLAVLLFMTLFRFSAHGPIWNNFSSSYQLCEDTWWATLLYVQNYAAPGRMKIIYDHKLFKYYEEGSKAIFKFMALTLVLGQSLNMCLGHSWYLAVDTQLYFISPLVLILIWRWRRWGLAALTFIGLLLVACLFSIIIYNDFIVFQVDRQPGSNTPEMSKTYYATHARTSPWIVGILFGYYLHFHKSRRIVLSKFLVILGWLIAIGLFLTVIFVLYPKTQPNSKEITPLEGAFYLSLSHVAWPLGLCWIVFACVNGYGGPVNEFLSWVIWQPLSKLSYSMYIWHLLIVTINAGQIKTNSHLSNYDAFLRFWSDFGITLIVSTVMYLTIEAPMLEIEKHLLPKKVKSTKDKQAITTISQQNLCD